MNLPDRYSWLTKEPAPKILLEALKLYGTTEAAGAADNPEILAWARELGIDDYVHDAEPWCGLFMALIVTRAGYIPPPIPVRALAWSSWGSLSPIPMLGDVLIFKRTGGGHVGLYVAEDTEAFHVFGGNEKDRVMIERISRDRFFAARRSPWKIAQPPNVRRIIMPVGDSVSSNEA